MERYTVTLELETPRWKRALRLFNIIPQRKEFDIMVSYYNYDIGDIIASGVKKTPVKIVDIHRKK